MKLSPFLSPPPFLTHASSASSSLQSLLKSGFSPTLNSIDNLFLHLYRGQKFNFIVYLLYQLDSNRIHIRYRTYSIVSWAFLSLRKFEEAERFINTHISKSSIFPRTRMLDSLIHGFCVERDDPEKALAVLRNCLRNRGAFPSSNTFCSLIHRHVAKGNMASAVEVLEMMADEKVNYPFDNFVCSAMISGFCKIGKPQLALGFFEHALNSGALKPDLVTYTALATALCRLGKIDEVSELFRSVENEGFELDTVFYNNWIYGHLREGALMNALLQHRKMVEKGINPDIIGYTILIDGFSKEGNMEEAVGLLGKMMKEGIEPNSVTFTAIMNGFCKKGKLEEAFALFERVLEMGIEVDEFMYATLIDGLCRKGNIDGVFSMLEEMEQRGIKPGIFTYNTVIYGLCKTGRVAEADEISKSVSGNVATYSTLLHGYILEENIDGVLETRRRFEEAKIPMNVAMCNVLLKAHLMVGALGEADALYKAMPDMDLIADSVTYLTMIQGYCKAGWIEEALEIFDELRKTSLSSVACYNCIVDALCKKGMLDTATVVFIELCQKGMGLDMCTLQTLMRAIFAREGEEGILSLLYRLGSLHSDVRLAIFNDAIWFLCNRGSSEAAVEVYMVMRSRGLALTSETYNLLLIGLLANGKHSLARPLMSIPVKEYGIAEPMVGEMISCFLCLKDTDKALAFLRNTRESNSAFTFPPEVLKILVDDGRALDAYSLAMGAEVEFTSMDVVDYSIVIDGLSKEGYMVKALDLCAFAKSKGIALNIIVYNSVIYGLCHQGCFTEAFRLFDSLEKIGLVPSEVTYAILIDNLSKEGFLLDAKKLLDKMVSKGFEPDIRVYNSMIDGCCKFGKTEEALTILSQIKMRGVTPDAFTVSSLIKGYSRKGDIEEALKVFNEFKENDILADFPGYLYLIKGFFTKGRMEESRSILREMLVSESVLKLLNRVEVEAESEPVRSFLVDLCERGSIHQAITILDEISSMFYPAGKGLSFCPKQQFLDKPCEQEALPRNNLQSLSSSVREEDTPMEDYTGDTDESHLPDFHHLYSVVSSLCSEGKLLQANRFVRTAISGLQR